MSSTSSPALTVTPGTPFATLLPEPWWTGFDFFYHGAAGIFMDFLDIVSHIYLGILVLFKILTLISVSICKAYK